LKKTDFYAQPTLLMDKIEEVKKSDVRKKGQRTGYVD
jgi:hypothetical protein